MICQLYRLRHCDSRPGSVQEALNKLPETLDGTYERTLEDIDDGIWENAHRLFQCISVACRPLRVEELAEFLAFKSEAGGSPTFDRNWPLQDRIDTVMSTCSSLLAVVDEYDSQVMQFSHFTVKEYLTTRIMKDRVPERVSRYHIMDPPKPAHTFVTQACLSVILQLDNNLTYESIKELPLARYAGQYWTEHAEFVDVESPGTPTEDLIKRLFHPETRYHHLLNWAWIYDTILDQSTHTPRPNSHFAFHLALHTPLHYAARHGFLRVTEWLLTTHSQNINVSGYDGCTPLQIASRFGQFKVAQVLLSHHADVNVCDLSFWTPLHHAAYFGSPEVTKLLLEGGAHVNLTNASGVTPLRLLSENSGNLETAQLLLDGGAYPSVRCDDGWDSLYMALREGYQGLAQLLLKRRADPNTRDDDGQTLLHVSCRSHGDLKVAGTLLEHGADVDSRDNRGQTPLQMAVENRVEVGLIQLLLEHDADPNTRDDDGRTLLHAPSLCEQLDVAERLLVLGVDKNSRDNRGQTPLQIASESYSRSFRGEKGADLVQLLLKHGADPNILDDDGQTLLHVSSLFGHLDIVETLLELGLDINARDNRGQTPLQIASEGYYGRFVSDRGVDLVQLLLNHGADPNTLHDAGQTLLHLSSKLGHPDTVEMLLKLGVDVDSRDERGQTPLQVAVESRVELGLIQLLLKHGADPNTRDDDGQTLLHVSSRHGPQEVAERLLELGVDVNSRDNRGQTPLQIALNEYTFHRTCHRSHYDVAIAIVQLLLKHGADLNTRDDDGQTLLHGFSRYMQLEDAERLLELGVDTNSRDDRGQTPLQMSLEDDEDEVVQLLLQHGAKRS